jgi:2,3-bisphosphoglycerate-independent phosphoglycerate mutase
MSILLLFIDGIGLGDDDAETNPFVAAVLPALDQLLDNHKLIARNGGFHNERASLVSLDATLGIPGLPQSGTGQTALFTGENAAKMFGRHFGPWVPTPLRSLLAEHNFLTRVKNRGGRAAFANAYPEEVFEPGRIARDPLRAGPPIAAIGAGVLTRHTPELLRGDAIASEITNDGWRKHLNRTELPVISAHAAGENLARIADQNDVTLFAHYTTDHVGHEQDMSAAIAALERVDEFLAGLLADETRGVDIVIASDHGNLEDVRTGHTTNPAVGLFIGPNHRALADGATTLMDVAPRILKLANPHRDESRDDQDD